jgi:DNA-3-methyladenine glycosylase II
MHRKAINHLKRVDPKLKFVIETVGRCGFAPRSEGTHFEAVTRSIAFQQLSGKAAATIYGRFCALFPDNRPEAKRLLKLSDEHMRGVGLSRQKIAYLKDLATRVQAGELAIESLHEMEDDEIMRALTSVKGIGPWTAQMFLMFRLGRLDVLPELDLGVQKAVQRAYRMRKLPSPKRLQEVGKKWAPYRTIASWYLWRSLEADVGDDLGW